MAIDSAEISIQPREQLELFNPDSMGPESPQFEALKNRLLRYNELVLAQYDPGKDANGPGEADFRLGTSAIKINLEGARNFLTDPALRACADLLITRPEVTREIRVYDSQEVIPAQRHPHLKLAMTSEILSGLDFPATEQASAQPTDIRSLVMKITAVPGDTLFNFLTSSNLSETETQLLNMIGLTREEIYANLDALEAAQEVLKAFSGTLEQDKNSLMIAADDTFLRRDDLIKGYYREDGVNTDLIPNMAGAIIQNLGWVFELR